MKCRIQDTIHDHILYRKALIKYLSKKILLSLKMKFMTEIIGGKYFLVLIRRLLGV